MHTFSSPAYSGSPFYYMPIIQPDLDSNQNAPNTPKFLKFENTFEASYSWLMRDLAASLLATLTLNCWLTCSMETAVCFIASRPPSFSPGLKTLSSEILRAPPIGLPANLEHHRVNYNQQKKSGIENKMNFKTYLCIFNRKNQVFAN